MGLRDLRPGSSGGRPRSRRRTDGVEGEEQVPGEVIDVFEADREADDSVSGLRGGGDGAVDQLGRILDEGVVAAEGDCMDDELEVLDDVAGGFEASVDVDRDHRTPAVQLPTDEAAGIASGQTGVMDLRDLRPGPQPAGEF